MTQEYIYDSGMGALAHDKGFDKLNFLDVHLKTGTETAQYEAEARGEFPYPPLNCDDAVTSSAAIGSKIQALNESIASGIDIKPNQARIAALQKVKTDFDVYINKANCVKQALASEDAAFNQTWQDLLNKEQGAASSKSNADTWLVIAGIGLLLVGAVVIILKKKKS